MSYPTFGTLIQKTMRKLRMVNATGAQYYAEDAIADSVQEAFNTVFDLEWWPQFRVTYMRTLDATTGLITQTMDEITRLTDIKFIRAANRGLATIPLLPEDVIASLVTGTSPLYYEPYNDLDGKLFKIVPVTSEGDIYIFGRAKPDDFDDNTDVVKFDDVAMVNAAAWEYMETDGSNPGAAEMFQIKFESRLSELRKQYRSQPVLASSNRSGIPLDWFER